MAYTKQTWTSGETVTAAKLNHMEDGIANGESGGSGVLVVHVDNNYTMDKTWQEITDALNAGMVVTSPSIGTFSFIARTWVSGSVYMLSLMYASDSGLQSESYETDSANGNPVAVG